MRVLVQEWEESERGWGTRPDGYSIHQNAMDLSLFIDEYWKSMPDYTPDEYSRPTGYPFWHELSEVDEDRFITDVFATLGIRTWSLEV